MRRFGKKRRWVCKKSLCKKSLDIFFRSSYRYVARMIESHTIRIRHRLLRRVLLFSILLTILFAAFQAAIDYRIRLRAIDANIERVVRVQLAGMSRALWNYDEEQLNAHITGIAQLPYFTYAAVLSNEETLVNAGVPGNGRSLEHRISLTHADREIGHLLLQADTAGVLHDTLRNVLLIFPFQAIAVTVVALFLLGLFDRMVIRHLIVAAGHFKTFDLETPGLPLQLDKRDEHDEIDLLVRSFNRLRKNLSVAYRRQTESIRQLRESKEALRQNRQMLARILDLVPMSIFWKNETGIYQGCNKVFAAEAGLDAPEDIIGKSDHDLRWKESAAIPREEEDLRVAQDKKARIRVIEQQSRTDGTTRWLSVSRIPLLDEHGAVRGLLGVQEDITERKRADELRLEKDAAERANKSKSAFLANMSHEIRTPLNAILGFSKLLQRETGFSPDQQKKLDTVVRSGEHLLYLINNILEFSKIEAGRVVVRESVFDLRSMLDDLEIMFRLRVDSKRLYMRVEPEPSVPRCVNADEGKLRQILINLVGNAVKFTEQGGITIRAAADEGVAGKRTLTVEVADTGPGIGSQEMENLFQSFQQTSTGVRAGGGTGLGLAISRQIARLMGGDIQVESRPGQGSRFVLTLPVAAEGEQACALVPPSPTRPVSHLSPDSAVPRVLIVDDVEANRDLVRDILKSAGFHARITKNGQEALECFQAWKPDLILMDLVMPVMDGYEAIRRIRALPDGARVKILAISASTFIETQKEVVELGADDFLGKPIIEDLLFDKIARLCGVHYVYREERPAPPDTTAETATVPPSREDLLALLELARMGDMSGIAERAEDIRNRNPASARFLEQLTAWARSYEEKRIREYIEDHLSPNRDDTGRST